VVEVVAEVGVVLAWPAAAEKEVVFEVVAAADCWLNLVIVAFTDGDEVVVEVVAGGSGFNGAPEVVVGAC
jgi:hypothetical protein